MSTVSKSRTAADHLSEAIRQLELLENIVPDGEYWRRVRRRAAALAMSLEVFLPDVQDLDATIKPRKRRPDLSEGK